MIVTDRRAVGVQSRWGELGVRLCRVGVDDQLGIESDGALVILD